MYTVKDLSVRYSVTEETVRGWIRAGEIIAVNVGRKPTGKKPRWRITQEALDAFEITRTPTPPLPRAQRRKGHGAIIEFYK